MTTDDDPTGDAPTPGVASNLEALPEPLEWHRLRGAEGLHRAWRALHAAAFAIGRAAERWGEPQPEDAHTALRWSVERRALVGAELPGRTPVRFALRVEDLELVVLDAEGLRLAALRLEGRGFGEALEWAEEHAAGSTGHGPRRDADEPDDAPRLLGAGETFDCDEGARIELARRTANASALLGALHRELDADEPLCRPHHFDYTALATLARDPDGRASRTLGYGLSPPDGRVERGYWYVRPWPAPAPEVARSFAAPRGGEWRADGPPLAVLDAEALAELGSGHAQAARVAAFLRSARASVLAAS